MSEENACCQSDDLETQRDRGIGELRDRAVPPVPLLSWPIPVRETEVCKRAGKKRGLRDGYTRATASEAIQSLLSGLILLERDAIGAYVRVVDRLEDAGAREEVSRFLQNRHRRLAELTKMILKLRIGAPRECDATNYLKTGRITLGSLAGDGALLKAMAAGESETVAAYERARAHPEALPEHRAVFERSLREARQHSSWMERAAQT